MNKSLVKYLAALVLFGTNGVIASKTLMPSSDIVVARIALGLVPLVMAALAKRLLAKKCPAPSVKGAALVFASGAAMGLGWICLFDAYSRIGVGLSTLMYYFGPVIVMALSPLLFKEKMGLGKGICFVVVLLGSCLVGGASLSGGADPVGVLLGIGAAVSYAVLVILGKKASGIDGVDRAVVQLAGALVAVVVARAAGGYALVPPVPGEGLLFILVLGVINTGFGCYLYFTALPFLKSQTVAVCGYLEPLSATIFSALLLGEALSAPQLIGGVMIIGGAAVFDGLKGARAKVE